MEHDAWRLTILDDTELAPPAKRAGGACASAVGLVPSPSSPSTTPRGLP